MTEFDNAVEAYKNHLMETDVTRKNTFLQLARNIANVSKDDDITIENVKEEATRQVKQELAQKEQQKQTQQSASEPKRQGFIAPNSLTGKVKQMLSRKKKQRQAQTQQPQTQQPQTQRINPDDLISRHLERAKEIQGGKTSLQPKVKPYKSPKRQSIPLPKNEKMDNIMEKVKAIKDPKILARIKQIIDGEEVGKSLRIIRDELPSSDLINKMKINQILKMIEE